MLFARSDPYAQHRLVENAALELLVRFLAKLSEEEDDQRQGVYNILSIFENLSELQPAALEAVCSNTDLVDWLFKRLKAKPFDQNKAYASEILSILVQGSEATQRRVGGSEGIDRLLAVSGSPHNRLVAGMFMALALTFSLSLPPPCHS